MKLSTTSILCLAFLLAGSAEAARVQTVRTPEGWQLLVNGKPFWVKGVGLNESTDPAKVDSYLKMARDLGANSIRTWGGASRTYLDQADAHGLLVNLGFWIDPVRANSRISYRDTAYRKKVKQEALAYVAKMKDHPAVLSWNIGNEILGFTEDPAEQAALGEFLADLYNAVHKLDPDHPIMYASPSTRDLPYLKKWLPMIDIVGINTYGGFSGVQWLKNNNWDKPVIATEFGPIGSWSLRKDANGQPWEAYDHVKGNEYLTLWRHIEKARPVSLGGYAFVLGDFRNQDSLTWFNINYETEKRDAYWKIREAFTGEKHPANLPQISQFLCDKTEGLKPGDQVRVSISTKIPAPAETRVEYFLSTIAVDPLIVEEATVYPLASFPATSAAETTASLTIPKGLPPKVYRLYAKLTDAHKNTAVATRSIRLLGS